MGLNVGILVVVGLLVGVVGGMFGVGGAIILIPALTEVLGPNQHLYQSTAMIVNLFVAVPAVYQHRRANAIDFATVRRITPPAAAAVVLGVGVSEMGFFAGPGEAYLRGLFGLFLFASAAYDVYRLTRRRDPGQAPETKSPPLGWKALAAVAIPTGFASGLLGVGGGIIAVPLQRRFLHLPVRTAIANSAAIIVATSIVGATFKNYAFLSSAGVDSHGQPLLLAAILVPTAVAGSLVGSHLTHTVPVRFVKGAFVFLLLVASVRLIQGALSTLPV